MKTVVLAGGLGTRLAEETEFRPKPMVEIGSHPIIWHIMKRYAHFGFTEFFIALGYKGDLIKHFFMDYHFLRDNLTIHLSRGKIEKHAAAGDDWTVHLMDTGLETMTGGRVKRLEPWLKDSPFMVTYGDGLADVNLAELVHFHRSHGKIATITAVRPPSRFGGLIFDGDRIAEFSEKPQVGEGWINGGFMVFEPAVFNYLKDDHSVLEVNGLEKLALEGQLMAYKHERFWQCMDTIRDKRYLEKLWQANQAPWRIEQ
ncbi:MAG: glucose-1-phosphate cytidylyltransferase [Lentisphaerae bacterium]|nr:glucose-1-phosphate cytidylyltransferase [Lentisphaerota bacterium]